MAPAVVIPGPFEGQDVGSDSEQCAGWLLLIYNQHSSAASMVGREGVSTKTTFRDIRWPGICGTWCRLGGEHAGGQRRTGLLCLPHQWRKFQDRANLVHPEHSEQEAGGSACAAAAGLCCRACSMPALHSHVWSKVRQPPLPVRCAGG